MKEELSRAVWAARLNPKTKYVLLALLYLAEEDGRTVNCPRSAIAERTGMSERTVMRHLRKLEKLGWIGVIEEARQHLPRVYTIKNPKTEG